MQVRYITRRKRISRY